MLNVSLTLDFHDQIQIININMQEVLCLIFATIIQHNLYSNLRYPNRFRRALLLFCNPMITESLDMTISLASTERETWKLFFVLLRLEIKTEILSWPSQWVSLICSTMNLETLPRLHGKSKYTIWSIKVILEIIILYFIDWIR